MTSGSGYRCAFLTSPQERSQTIIRANLPASQHKPLLQPQKTGSRLLWIFEESCRGTLSKRGTVNQMLQKGRENPKHGKLSAFLSLAANQTMKKTFCRTLGVYPTTSR